MDTMTTRLVTLESCTMAGKKRVVDRSVSWRIRFHSTDKSSVTVQIRGGDCPVLTLADMDKVDREYVSRQLAGMPVSWVEFEKTG